MFETWDFSQSATFLTLNASLIYFLIEAGEHSFSILTDFQFRLIFRFLLTLSFVQEIKKISQKSEDSNRFSS